jgi:hypothetical protein
LKRLRIQFKEQSREDLEDFVLDAMDITTGWVRPQVRSEKRSAVPTALDNGAARLATASGRYSAARLEAGNGSCAPLYKKLTFR